MNDNEIQAAKEQLEKLRTQINNRKKALAQLNDEKERWFNKRAEIGKQIAERIRDVKDKRAKRDELTAQVQEEKKERRNYSQEIRDKIAEVKKLREERDKAKEASQGRGQKSPAQLKREIEGIEFKLETSPMPYNEERKLTRVLKEKKAAYEKVRGVGDLSKKIRELSKEIDELKKESDEVHESLQGTAEDSQEFHEDVIAASKKIDELKEEEDAAYKNFSDLKDEYVAGREELQKLLDEAEVLSRTLTDHGEQVAAIEKATAKKKLKEEVKRVEEKVKKKEKLTTEDLLAFQAGD